MYDVTPCPSCYSEHIVCVTCKIDKPKMPCGEWAGSWWYCGAECLKTPKAPGEMCGKHREALERLKIYHPHLFK